jgi:hypothetical protein
MDLSDPCLRCEVEDVLAGPAQSNNANAVAA